MFQDREQAKEAMPTLRMPDTESGCFAEMQQEDLINTIRAPGSIGWRRMSRLKSRGDVPPKVDGVATNRARSVLLSKEGSELKGFGAHVSRIRRPGNARLSEVIAEYCEQKQKAGRWTLKTSLMQAYRFAAMVELIGDRPIRDLTKDDARVLLWKLHCVPSRIPSRYPGLTVVQAIEAADKNGDLRRLAPASINIWVNEIRSLFKWAIGQEYIERSPMAILRGVAEANEQRRAFTNAELVSFFEVLAESPTDIAMQWVPRLMLYAGLRTEEAAGLRGCDIREESGVWVVDVRQHRDRRLKTAAATRIVPVHESILPQLLARACTVMPRANLWGLEKDSTNIFSNALSKRLSHRLRVAVANRDRLVMHSLRLTFSTRLMEAGVQEHVISKLLGNKIYASTLSGFEAKPDLARLKHAVARLVLPDETLPERLL
jgi:integrase